MIKDPDGLTQPIIDIYNQIEYDLIIDIAKRFDTYDTIGGTLEWQLKKLDELGTLNADMVKTIAKYSKKSQKEIYDMLKSAGFANIDFEDLQKAYNAGAILVDPVTIRNNTVFAELVERSYKELDETFRMIQTKALESAKQSYMDVINRAYIEVATGTYDYNTSIRNAIQRMAENGITGATYKRGEKIVKYSLEATVRRDTLTAVHKLANQSVDAMCEEIGTDYVEISSHLGARVHPTNKIANHAGWQGKVFKIHGEDPEYPNLKESTGYPDDILGLGGVNCRHRMFPFVPGISTPNPINFSEEENRKAYELSQQQRKLERDMRKLKKKKAAAEALGDKETAKKLKEKIKLKSDEIDKFCEDNKLKRDYNRELVTEQISKKVAKSENSDIIKAGSEKMTINSIEKPIDFPIEQRNTGKGNPNAILQIGRPLNNRQQQLLSKLPSFDSRVIVMKNDVKMSDLSALTAVTGDEFAMFTKGGERLIIRGSAVQVNVDNVAAKELSELGYRWSGHTHPGFDYNSLQASPGDKAVLQCFNQKNAVIYNSKGQFLIFERE